MDRERKWFGVALAIMLLAVGINGLFSYVVDPYGLFRKDFKYQFVEPNRNFIKARYLTEHPDRYDCLVFGSSRVNSIDVRKIRDYRCYNMTCNHGLPGDHLDNLKYMIKKGVKVRMVLVGLDEFDFREDPAIRLAQPLRHPYPPVVGQYVLPFYLRYLFSFHDRDLGITAIKGYLAALRGGAGAPISHDIFDTGQMSSPQVDRDIDANPEAHRNKLTFRKHEGTSGDYMKGVIEDLRGLVETAQSHHIRLILFVNPLYKTAYLDSGLEEFDHFKRELSNLSDFYDFSGINSVTSEALNYYEATHYRPFVGDMILSRVLRTNIVPVPPDFGVLVTSRNAEQHLRALRLDVPKEILIDAPR
jgi:hypothetical protein